MPNFTNTHLLQPAANYFREHGAYCKEPAGTKGWRDYWREQKRRCIEGYEAGGTYITGYHYWYLNFCRVDQVKHIEHNGKMLHRKEVDFPRFWDYDHTWFWLIEIATNGISKELYNRLELMVDVAPEAIESGGYHLACLKSRRKGYSYKSGATMSCDFHLGRNVANYAFAYDEGYLSDEGQSGLLDKVWTNVFWNNEYSAWKQPFLKDSHFGRKAGYRVKDSEGHIIEKGLKNSVTGVSFHDNPDKSRGKDARRLYFEEAGKFRDLIRSWEVARSTAAQGGYVVGNMIAFGTGGSGGEDMVGLEELFRRPEAYGVLPIYNQWEDGLQNTYCGFFVPVYMNMDMFMDEDGNSDIESAIEHEKKSREQQKHKKQEAYTQYIAENPMTPAEALMETNANIFPVAELMEQKSRVKAENLDDLGVNGYMINKEGKPKFQMDPKAIPVDHYPHKKSDKLQGCIRIWEQPYRIRGEVPKQMYFMMVDPFALNDAEDLTSLGSAYIFKATNNMSPTYNELPVASYVGRPRTTTKFNEQIFQLAEYYNAKIGFENDRGDIVAYARANRKLDRLMEEPEFDFAQELKSNSRRKYGMHMTNARKYKGILYINDWLNEVISKDEDGHEYTRINYIYDIGLLEELIKFKEKGNFDRISALIIGMFYSKEMQKRQVKKVVEENQENDFFKSIYKGLRT